MSKNVKKKISKSFERKNILDEIESIFHHTLRDFIINFFGRPELECNPKLMLFADTSFVTSYILLKFNRILLQKITFLCFKSLFIIRQHCVRSLLKNNLFISSCFAYTIYEDNIPLVYHDLRQTTE